MTTQTQESIRLDAWRSVFEKTNRILSEQRVNVSIVSSTDQGVPENVPAWTDGLDIYLSQESVLKMLSSNDKMAAVLRLKGLNYHELCHVLYTPRMSDELPRRIQERIQNTGDRTLWYAFNALEDQRIETWFTSTYGASRRYFEATVLEWIIKNGSVEAAVLIYGRKYLTPRIRVQAGRVFVKRYGQELYDEFKTVIDEYLTLILPTDSIKAMSLIIRYVELLEKMRKASGAPLPALIINDNGGGVGQDQHNHGMPKKGRILIKPARAAAKRAGEVIEDAIDADMAEEARQEDGSGEGKAQQADQEGSAEGSGSGQGESTKGKPVDDTADSSGGAGASGSGSSNDHVAKKSEKIEDLMSDLVDEAHGELDDVRDDEWVQNDVDNLLDAIKAAEQNGKMNAQGKAVGGAVIPPSSDANMAVRRVHDILARIRQDAEPETLWRQSHGRVDARRVVQRKPHETDIFKTWDHGSEEETGVEAVVLVDVSGSMDMIMAQTSANAWALKRAFDRLDIRTTVLIFDTDHSVLYQPGEKAAPAGVPVLRSGGGTNPTSALIQAQRILAKSQEPNKVLITVTDGSWSGDENQRLRMMKSMHGSGVVSMLLGLNRAHASYGKHGHMEGHDIQSVAQLPKAALKLVANIMRNAVYV